MLSPFDTYIISHYLYNVKCFIIIIEYNYQQNVCLNYVHNVNRLLR